MSRIAVVYWSGTGNTKAMAESVAQGVRNEGAEVVLYTAPQFRGEMMDEFDAVAFGCPAMGAEQLEEEEFEPMFAGCEPKLKGRKIALFGSYDWGEGEWMKTWEDTCISGGALLAYPSVICHEAPNEAGKEECEALGEALAR